MDFPHIVDYWRKTAARDWRAAQHAFEKRDYPHALFWGHLYIEKLLKALFVRREGTHAPYGHALIALAEKAGLEINPELRAFLVDVTKFNLGTRYPEDQPKLYKEYTRSFCESKLNEIRKVGKWLESLIE